MISKKNIIENTHELCTGVNLIDVSRLPKDITLQILESDYITKKKNRDFVQNVVIKSVYNIHFFCEKMLTYNI